MSELQFHADAKTHDKVWDMIEGIKTPMACTHGEDGKIHARPMMAIYYNEATGELVFFARKDSRFTDEIHKDRHILLSYADSEKQHYVAVTGKVTSSTDLYDIEEHWIESARVWFPDGPKDSNLILMRVNTEIAEYWDSPNSMFTFGFSYMKSRITGKPPHLGEMGKIAL